MNKRLFYVMLIFKLNLCSYFFVHVTKHKQKYVIHGLRIRNIGHPLNDVQRLSIEMWQGIGGDVIISVILLYSWLLKYLALFSLHQMKIVLINNYQLQFLLYYNHTSWSCNKLIFRCNIWIMYHTIIVFLLSL